jgi:Tol biopolymer transport system component
MAGGTPRPLLDNVASADWAPDGRTLAIVRHKEGKAILEYPVGTVLHETLGWIGSPRVSPDGARVAFIDHDYRADDAGRICIAERGKEIRVVSTDFASAQGLAWGRDGKSLWCTAAPMGANRSLMRFSLDGSSRTILRVPGSLTLQDLSPRGDVLVVHGHERAGIIAKAPGEDRERDLSWYDWSLMRAITADGSTVLFDESGEGGGQHRLVCIRGTDGSPAIAIGEGSAQDITPDGTWVLSVNIADPHCFTVIPTGIGEPRTISLGDLMFHAGAFFPDGSRAAIIAADAQGSMRPYLVDLVTGERRLFSETDVGAGIPQVSPDGSWIAMSGQDFIVRLHPAAGGDPVVIPGMTRGERVMGWGADSRQVYAFLPGPPPVQVYRIDVKTGQREPHLVAQPPDPTGIEGVMGVRQARDGDGYAYTYVVIMTELYLLEGAA